LRLSHVNLAEGLSLRRSVCVPVIARLRTASPSGHHFLTATFALPPQKSAIRNSLAPNSTYERASEGGLGVCAVSSRTFGPASCLRQS